MAQSPNTRFETSGRIELSTTVTNITSGSNQMFGWNISNGTGSAVWIQFFNALASDVILGITAPTRTLLIPAGTPAVLIIEEGPGFPNFSTALSCAATTTETGNTAPASAISVEIFYQ